MNQDYHKEPDFWNRQQRSIQSDFICRPQAINLLRNIRNLHVIDLGCGDGYLSRILASLDAKVTGVDNEQKLIDSAVRQEQQFRKGIDYHLGDVTELPPSFERGVYDKALSVNVTPHLTYEQMRKAFEEVNRVLKSRGCFVLAAPHPKIWVDKPQTNWIEYGYESFAFERDVTIPIALFDGGGRRFPQEEHFDIFPHSEEEYEDMLRQSGFDIVSKVEPLATEEDMKHFPERWGLEDRIPFYTIYHCKKIQ